MIMAICVRFAHVPENRAGPKAKAFASSVAFNEQKTAKMDSAFTLTKFPFPRIMSCGGTSGFRVGI